MFSPRWRKVVRDILGNKARTILVVLSIAVGVFAVGAIAHMYIISTRDLAVAYDLVQPAHALIVTNESFDDDLIRTVRRIDGVSIAEGQREIGLRFKTSQTDQWSSITLVVISDYEHMSVNKIAKDVEYAPDRWGTGAFPPPYRQIVLASSTVQSPLLNLTNNKPGDALLVELPNGKQREMRLAGLAYDFSATSAILGGARGFITPETAKWLGQESGMNRLYLRVTEAEQTDEGIKRVSEQVKDKIEKSGRTIAYMVPYRPGEMPMQFLFQALTLLLGMLGVMALFLSMFLVFNTVSAQIAQQVRQIGVMKAVGARPGQIAVLYLEMVSIFGALALAVAVPLAIIAAGWFVALMASFMNFRVQRFYLPSEVLVLEIALGLGVPLFAALAPIISGTRITVREAMSSYGVGESRMGRAGKPPLALPLISRPLLLSLRNTFRRKTRLVMTLITLSLAGTIFVSVFNVHTSLSRTLETTLQYYKYDVAVTFGKEYPRARVEAEALNVPGVVKAEGWATTTTYRVRPDGTESPSIMVYGPPASSEMIDPIVLQGRWLMPEDENAVVIGTELLRSEPDVRVGSEIVLKLGGRETKWRVVGVVRTVMMSGVLYANYSYLTKILGHIASAAYVVVLGERHDQAAQTELAAGLKDHLLSRGLKVASTETTEYIRAAVGGFFSALFALLMAMVLLMLVVGGLGLMGTMGLNVLERTREIGILRAIGASNGAVRQLVIVEGVLIGLISGLVSVVLALPVGQAMGNVIGVALFKAELRYAISVQGTLLWLALVAIIAVVASALPAESASRVTVREVLAYE